MLGRFLIAALATILVACGSGDPGTGSSPPPPPPLPPPPAAPVVTVSVTPSAVERESSTSVVIEWRSVGAFSCASFWGDNLGTSGSYSLNPTTPVSGTITCVGEGGSRSAPISIAIVEPPHLRLGIVSADGQSVVAGLSARLRSGSLDTTLAFSGASLDVPLYESLRSRLGVDSVDVTIDRQGSGARAFLPLVGRIARAMALTGQNLPVVLIPRTWNISCGTYAGSQVGISLHQAYLPANETSAGFYATDWFWERFPRFVAFDRTESNAPISASDSVGMWSQLAEMESALCIDLYKPGTLDDIAADGGTRVIIDTSLPTNINGTAGYSRKNLNSPYLYWGVARFRGSSALNFPVVQHELGHTLGFGHSCLWPTLLFECASNDNFRLQLTAEDVAYIRLFYAARKLEVDRSSVLGLAASLRGERELILGLPSTASAGNAPAAARASTSQVPFGGPRP